MRRRLGVGSIGAAGVVAIGPAALLVVCPTANAAATVDGVNPW